MLTAAATSAMLHHHLPPALSRIPIDTCIAAPSMKNESHSEASARRLVICTLRFSPNVGDGVIAACLDHVVSIAAPMRSIIHLDLAGREAWAPADAPPSVAREVFHRAPPALHSGMTCAAWPVFMRQKVLRAWNRVVPQEDFDLVFGGGQLLSGVALNFPLKIGLVSKLAASRGAGVAFSGVGVSGRWGPVSRRMFRRAIARPQVCYVSTRDPDSRGKLERQLPELRGRVRLTADPALWAAETFGRQAPTPASGRALRIGLGISEPAELALYAADPKALARGRMLHFWRDLARYVSGAGHTPVLFTNGAIEDNKFLEEVARVAADAGVRHIERLPRPVQPDDLAAHISSMHALVSHRLHANILAYAFGVPSVALAWDAKVRAFAELTQRDRWCLNEKASPKSAFALVESALAFGVDANRRDALKREVQDEVGIMLDSMQTSERA